jgi:hypothetical protein
MGFAAVLPYIPAIASTVGSMFGGGKKKKAKKRSTLSPEEQKLHQDYISGLRGEGPMAGMFNFNPEQVNSNFENMVARPAYRQFQENIIPGITGQFRGANIGNSSYTGEALGRAGRNVQESLDAQRANALYKAEQSSIDRKMRGVDSALNIKTFDWERPQESGGSPFDKILGMAGEHGAKFLVDKFIGSTGSAASIPGVA